MATEKQIEANRLKAQRSTGPRTREGKARVGTNALRHGLTAKRVLLAIEDPAEFEAFRDSIIEAYDPYDAAEAMLVDRIVEHAWRLRRVPSPEAGLYNRRCYAEGMALAGYKSSRRSEVALRRPD